MPKKKTSAATPSMAALKDLARGPAARYLEHRNVTSVGVAYKVVEGKPTKELAIQFTVGKKVAPEALEALGTVKLPSSFEVDGVQIPTDVVERSYETSAREVRPETAPDRKVAANPLVPGISVGHPTISAGTIGCVVYDAATAEPYILSNWHVLHGSEGELGDDVVQPGHHDDNRVDRNVIGKLVRSHLGPAGDCAIATVRHRQLSNQIMSLGVEVSRIGEPDLEDRVIKSGRTTGVTRGIVNRLYVTAKLDYEGVGEVAVGGFEIGPDPSHPAGGDEISLGGDSGSAWLFVDDQGAVTDMMVGLHFAGETGDEPDHALACYAKSVFEKLQITAVPLSAAAMASEAARGFDIGFLGGGHTVALPEPANAEIRGDLFELDGRTVIDYTHFSLALSRSRRFARWVAWNIDGGSLRKLSRKGIRFRRDARIPGEYQAGDEIYSNNPLDRGHLARRADLLWGSLAEAKKANTDSFYFTNIAPQHAAFNQSGASGIWGELENAVFAEVDVEDLKISVIAGPVLDDDDPPYRGIRLPKEFWKILYFREAGRLVVKAYMLTQRDLLNQLEALELPEFSVYEIPISDAEERVNLKLGSSQTVATETQGRVRRLLSAEEALRSARNLEPNEGASR
jgi:endonuclease G